MLNLEGLQTRYEHPEEPLAEIAAAPRETVTELMQRLYRRRSATTWSRGGSMKPDQGCRACARSSLAKAMVVPYLLAQSYC